ncbi:MAG: autotransporter outer membrane beta-barrel domain-containing protein [Alphaproteobacteria bacterium]|nr:autotransporter outer membrane beta-barrel domain-containing protein [Alphaproteobacteria bacterium]
MNNKVFTSFLISLLGITPINKAYSRQGTLAPVDFNQMYHLASTGKIGNLRNAVNRGLNIDATNLEGDTGLCIAIKRKNYIAYNSFRMSGANPKHACTYKIYDEYQKFLNSSETVKEDKILGNAQSLYYNEEETKLWPWILGGAIIGGGALALGGGGGGGGGAPTIVDDDTEVITPITTGAGLAGYIKNYYKLVETEDTTNILDITYNNDSITDINAIKMLPNALDISSNLKAFVKVTNGNTYENLGEFSLGNGTVGMASYGKNSVIKNNGNINISATNASVGIVASNSSTAYNGSSDLYSDDNGNINLSFKGKTAGNSLIGMYADTNSNIINYGKITSTTSEIENENSSAYLTSVNGKKINSLLDDVLEETPSVDDAIEETNKEPNSGTLVGMGLFNYYTGTNLSQNTVTATNYGTIDLSAGHNTDQDVGVSLIGMGSYIDDKFLNKNHNPAYAEQMKLNNDGNINLKYQGKYSLSKTALKLGDGGLIGIRADSQTTATNKGNIDINLTSTTLEKDIDVSAGMLAIHGAELINGDKDDNSKGLIKITNDATSGGISYGMLAAKGDGSQTRIYNWKKPILSNYGQIDIAVSNSYAMASFDGGEITNYGTINLGVENGHSYYTNNIGLYSEGKDISDAASLINKGIINVNSIQSVAMQQMFSGSVNMINDGIIYLSQKATGSKAFAGNFSTAINNKDIIYKVDNSENFSYPLVSEYKNSDWNVRNKPVASIINISANNETTKQDFTNNGTIILGDAISNNYNGTFGTAAIQVSEQGTAMNEEYSIDENGNESGLIWLKKADDTYRQLNVGLHLDVNAKRAAVVNNKGKIVVDSNHSMGILNNSTKGATAINNGDIYVNGKYSYGIAGTTGSYISNGMSTNPNANIYVNSKGSAGMFIQDGELYSFGNIYLNESNTFANIIKGKDAVVNDGGNIFFHKNLNDIVFYKIIDDADISVTREEPLVVDGYTFALVETEETGGTVRVQGKFNATVKGTNSTLLNINGVGSKGYISKSANDFTNTPEINIENSSTGIKVLNGGELNIDAGTINIRNENTKGISIIGNLSTEDISFLNIKGGNIYVSDSATGITSDIYSIINFNSGNLEANNALGINLNNNTLNFNRGNIKVIDGIGIHNNNNSITNISENAKLTIEATNNCSSILCRESLYSKGVEITSGEVINYGKITGSGMNKAGMGVKINSSGLFDNSQTTTHTGTIVDGQISSLNIGVYNQNNFINSGSILENYIGVYNQGGVITNTGDFNKNSYGIYQENGSSIIKEGTFANNEYAIYAIGGTVEINGGSIGNETRIIVGGKTGIYLKNANAISSASIDVGSGTGVNVAAYGSFDNSGTITVSNGTGIKIEKNGNATNSGYITVTDTGTGAFIEDGGIFSNSGTITYNSTLGSCTNLGTTGNCIDTKPEEDDEEEKELSSIAGIVMNTNSTLINKGIIDAGNQKIDFNSSDKANVILAKGGTFKGSEFSGEILASSDIVKGNFENSYNNKNSFIGKDEGLKVTSQSYMFDASTQNNEDKIDVILNRKSFSDIVEEKELAEFLELNYREERGKKIFDALKEATNKKEFNDTTTSQTGKNFYANITRENMSVIRKITDTQKKRILNNTLKDLNMGVSYFNTGKDKTDTLSSYSNNTFQAYIEKSLKDTKNTSYGLTLVGAYSDSDYDQADAERENKILMVFAPVLYRNNNISYLGMANLGIGYGEYSRNKSTTNYKADTFDIYYGLSNSLEHNTDLKLLELVAEAEFNFAGISSNKAKEKDGLTLKSNDALSLETGIGLKLRKTLKLDKQKSLSFEFGSKYYHEFLNPYSNLEATIKGSPLSFNAGRYNETEDRIKTTLGATYKDRDFSLSAEISHNNEKDDNMETTIDLRYHF